MKIVYPKKFLKHLDNQPAKIQDKFLSRIVVFTENKFNPILHNHALNCKYKGCRSINITGGIRAVFHDYEETVVFISIGTHSQLYG